MASLSISGPGGNINLQIDPYTGDTDGFSPPPIEQTVTGSRAIIIHEIPGREGNRKQDHGSDDDELSLIGWAVTADAGTLFGMKNFSNKKAKYTIIFVPDDGPGINYPPMWLRKCSIAIRKGTSHWWSFAMTFIAKNQTDPS
jgi:hypothetical protein